MSEEPLTVTLERIYDAPIDLVWRAWTEPEYVSRWMKCDANAILELSGWDARPGAEFTTHMVLTGVFDTVGRGRFTEVDPPRLLEYVLLPDEQLGTPEMRVRVELSELGERTRLVLAHSGIPNDGLCDIIRAGWTNSLGLLGDPTLPSLPRTPSHS